MKAFYIIVFIFAIMTLGILINGIQVSDFADSSIDALSKIEFSDTKACEEEVINVTNEISKKLDKLEFSIQRKKVNSIYDCIRLLSVQVTLGARTDFEMTRATLINQLLEIDDLCKISFSNIF